MVEHKEFDEDKPETSVHGEWTIEQLLALIGTKHFPSEAPEVVIKQCGVLVWMEWALLHEALMKPSP